MGLKKNLSFMGTTTAIRLGTGLFTFSVLARLMGPETFGVLMLWFSVAGLLALVTNFGFIPYVLREIGANPASAEAVINEGITAKMLLTAIMFVAVGVAWGLGFHSDLMFLCLLIAAVADSFSEFLNAGFRARNRFDIETRIATITALSHTAIICGLVYVSPTAEVAAFAYALSRLLVLGITIPAVAQYFATPVFARLGPSVARLRSAGAYAIDFGLQSLFGNIDSIVINHFVGPTAVGIYQAGMRIFQSGVQAAPVLSNVFLPRVSANHDSPALFTAENRRLQVAFISIGALFGLIMAALPRPIVNLLYGSTYSPLVDLMPFFGLLFFLRFSAGAWGIVLTAAGEQSYRAKLGIFHWVFALTTSIWLVPLLGSSGWLISLCAASVCLTVGYGLRARRHLTRTWDTAGLSILGGLAFLPFILAV